MSTIADLARVERELRDDASPHLGDGWSLHRKRQADTIAAYIARAKEQGYADIEAERDALRKDFETALEECKLLTHKVITCGVAASHPDASLAHTGAYKEKWDSPQAEEVRKLRAERDALRAEVEMLGDKADQYWRELQISKAEVALRKSEVELFRDKLKARCDEVAALRSKLQEDAVDSLTKEILAEETIASLRAACAAKDAALRSARELLHSSEWPSLCNNIDTALSDTAGTNWVDATGAVKAKVLRQTAFGNAWLEWTPMPADWAGASVLIIPKPKE